MHQGDGLITARALICSNSIGKQTGTMIINRLLAGEEDSPVNCTLIVEYSRCITGGDLLR